MAAAAPKSPSPYGCAANFVSLKPIEVPQQLQAGEKFIKWDEVSPEFFLGVPSWQLFSQLCNLHVSLTIDSR